MERTGNNPFVHIGRGLKDVGDFVGPEDQDSLISQGGRIVGQGVPMIAAMLLTGGVALPGLMAFGQGADYMADDSRQHQAYGTSEGDTAILKGGAISASTSVIATSALLSPAFERIKNVVLQFGARLGVGGIVGGAMAGGEQFGDNRLAQSLYDPDRDLWEGVGHRALLGAFGGVVLGLGVTALHVGSAKRGGLPTAKEADAIATLVENNAKAFEAGQIRENVSKLMDDVAASKVAARAPGEVAAMIRRTLGEENAHVTLAGDALFPLYIRPKLARELGLTQQDIIAAHLKGEDVSVDLGRLAVSEQARGLKDELLPHIRREREAMTEAEAAQWEKGGREAFVQEQLAQIREEGVLQDNTASHLDAQKPPADSELTNAALALNRTEQQAKQQAFQKMMGELRQEKAAQWKEESKALSLEIRAEIMKEPVNFAIEGLVFGRKKSGEEYVSSPKIRTQDIIDLKGEAFLDRLPGETENGQRKIIGPAPYAKDGEPAKHIASRFGFRSADEMLTQMAEARSPDIIVKERTGQEISRRHSEEMNDGALEQTANKAIHNERRGEVLALELEALGKAVGWAPDHAGVRMGDMTKQAKETISGLSVQEASRSGPFIRQEQKAAKAFGEAAIKGDFPAAIKAKEQQISAFLMVQESKAAKAEIDSIRRMLWKFAKSDIRTRIDARYLAPIDLLLEQNGFRPGVDQPFGRPSADYNNVSVDHLRNVNQKISSIALTWLKGESHKQAATAQKELRELGIKDATFPTKEAKTETARQLEETLAHQRDAFQSMAQRIANDPKGTRGEKREVWHGHLNEDQIPIVRAALEDPANRGHGFTNKNFDIKFAVRTFDDTSIRHALNNHRHDQLPLEPNDFRYIPDVLEKGEFVQSILEPGNRPSGKLVLVWRKEVDGKWLYVGERLRTGDTPTLTFATAYWNLKAKEKGGVSAALQ